MELCWVLRTGCSSDCEDNWPCKFECDKELMTCLGQCNWKDCGDTGTDLSTRPTVGMMQWTDAKMTFSYSVSTTTSPVSRLHSSRLTNKYFLVVNTNGSNKPMVLDYYGGAFRPTAITSGNEVSAYKSCSLAWKNQFYIFGGYKNQGTGLL